MSLIALVAQTTRELLPAPTSRPFIAPALLPVCCVCGLIRDEAVLSPDHERWVTQGTYRKAHGVNPDDFPLTHAYCQKCFTKAQESVRQYFQEVRTSPRPGSAALRTSTSLSPL